MPGDQSPPPDQEQRSKILQDLDTTILVEAAAGTGKTTCLIERMVALLTEGRCSIQTLAAVTFTRKAAAELRSQFQIALEMGVRETTGLPQTRLGEALTHIERCFIGTIHSFCARLLRERPVEAGVDITFREIDEVIDEHLRQQAWETFVATLYAQDDPLLHELDELGLSIDQLQKTFLRFADYPDVEEWPAPPISLPALQPAITALQTYVQHMESLASILPEDPGHDELIPKYRLIPRMVRHRQTDLHKPARLMEIFEHFTPVKIVLRNWPEGSQQAKAEHERWNTFTQNIVQPLVTRWQEYRYAPILQVLKSAQQVYDRLRRNAGVLNYQDLLIRAAELLRNSPPIRAYFRRQFSHILIDEFQDTDPIQAEVMLLLTADDPAEPEWRQCRPVPGSLFVVGDPKQSIYRFRRADIVTYNQVKEIIERSGGTVVSLSANFRTSSPVVEWINGVFAKAFPSSATLYSPSHVPLLPGRQEGKSGELVGVYRLEVPEDFKNQEAIAEYEAERIARTIRKVLDTGMTIPRTRREITDGIDPRATPGDFLIVTRTKKRLPVYARKLQEYGIPHEVTGGSALSQVQELSLLYRCLLAVIQPDNPVALVAVLRSALFGISDAALYAFKRAGGEFTFRARIPEGLHPADAEAFTDAFARLNRYAHWLGVLPAAVAIERIAADLGLLAFACAAPGGNIRAGSFAKALELLRAVQVDRWANAEIIEYLDQLIHEEEKDGIAVRIQGHSVVRVMNLHKVKGLEAPVVFLADPSGESNHEVDLYIERSGARVRGYLTVYTESGNWRKRGWIAKPPEWETLAARERAFQDAENQRLLYVAATRAGTQLIIAQRAHRNDRNPWEFFAESLQSCPALAESLPQQLSVTFPIAVTPNEVMTARQDIHQRWTRLLQPSYHIMRAKDLSMTPGKLEHVLREHGLEWGTVIHLLLQTVMTNPAMDIASLARSILENQEMDKSLAEAAVATVQSVMQSQIWQRALASPRRLVEVPFQTLVTATPLPAVQRGIIDLIFLEAAGWVIVDYKTDARSAGALRYLLEYYRPQIRNYVEAWQRITGQSVVEAGLYLTHIDQYVTYDYKELKAE